MQSIDSAPESKIAVCTPTPTRRRLKGTPTRRSLACAPKILKDSDLVAKFDSPSSKYSPALAVTPSPYKPRFGVVIRRSPAVFCSIAHGDDTGNYCPAQTSHTIYVGPAGPINRPTGSFQKWGPGRRAGWLDPGSQILKIDKNRQTYGKIEEQIYGNIEIDAKSIEMNRFIYKTK